jgi:hypothetical protein
MATEARQRAQAKYNSKPEQVKRRMARNRARAAMIREGRARKGDGKDVGHANGNPLDNRKGNLRMESKRANRSYPRKKNGSKRNPRD